MTAKPSMVFDIIPLCLKANNKSSKPRSASFANKTKFQLQNSSGHRFPLAENGESLHPFLPPRHSKRVPEKRFRCQHALRKLRNRSKSRLEASKASAESMRSKVISIFIFQHPNMRIGS